MKQSSFLPFKQRVIDIIRMVPYGKVVGYGQVALYCGLPRAARQVGWIMREMGEDVSWWRVLSNSGRISIEGNWYADKKLQKKLLEAEGIAVSDDFTLDIEKYRFIMPKHMLEKLQLPYEYIQKIVEKYGV